MFSWSWCDVAFSFLASHRMSPKDGGWNRVRKEWMMEIPLIKSGATKLSHAFGMLASKRNLKKKIAEIGHAKCEWWSSCLQTFSKFQWHPAFYFSVRRYHLSFFYSSSSLLLCLIIFPHVSLISKYIYIFKYLLVCL